MDHSWDFKLDDRQQDDVAYHFCNVTLTVEVDSSRFILTLFPVPISAELLEVVRDLEGEIFERSVDTKITLRLGVNQVMQIRKVVKEIRRITAQGRRYVNSNWKWICPRTANSLDRFANNLMKFRRAKRNGQLERDDHQDEGLFALADY